MPPSKWDVSVHEASHAVVAYEFKKPVNLVGVVTDGDSLGRTNIPAAAMYDWENIDIGDGMNPHINERISRRQRRTLAILVAGDVGNNIDAGLILVSKRLPAHVLADLQFQQATQDTALHAQADLTRAFEIALQLPDEAMNELLLGEETARRILLANWFKVNRIAKIVFQRNEISVPKLADLLRLSRRSWE